MLSFLGHTSSLSSYHSIQLTYRFRCPLELPCRQVPPLSLSCTRHAVKSWLPSSWSSAWAHLSPATTCPTMSPQLVFHCGKLNPAIWQRLSLSSSTTPSLKCFSIHLEMNVNWCISYIHDWYIVFHVVHLVSLRKLKKSLVWRICHHQSR